jgi:prephenate dehydratase
MASTAASDKTIAFQGVPGAYSDLACRIVYPDWSTLPCESFEDTFAAVTDGQAKLAMIPIDNSVAGRVADIHHLMPGSGLHIIAEHFQRIAHQLLAPKGATIEGLRTVHSHVHALSQCRTVIRNLGLKAVVHVDTAGAARDIAKRGDPTEAAIASVLAAERYGLAILKADIEDAEHNTTRFLVLAREAVNPDPQRGPVMTSFVFRVRNVPAALYKALGGFATTGVNMTKLESYMLGGRFSATQFYADVEGHPEERRLRLALEELSFFSREVRILGVYPAHPRRFQAEAAIDD